MHVHGSLAVISTLEPKRKVLGINREKQNNICANHNKKTNGSFVASRILGFRKKPNIATESHWSHIEESFRPHCNRSPFRAHEYVTSVVTMSLCDDFSTWDKLVFILWSHHHCFMFPHCFLALVVPSSFGCTLLMTANELESCMFVVTLP